MQTSFSDLEYAGKKERTRRERFLAPFYPTGKGPGRPPLGLSRMLRMYVAQQCFGLSDEGIEDAVYDSHAIRRFFTSSRTCSSTARRVTGGWPRTRRSCSRCSAWPTWCWPAGVCGRGTASVRPEGAQNPKYPAETRTFTQSTSENGPFFPQLDHALAPSCPRRRFRWIDQRFPNVTFKFRGAPLLARPARMQGWASSEHVAYEWCRVCAGSAPVRDARVRCNYDHQPVTASKCLTSPPAVVCLDKLRVQRISANLVS